MWDQCIQLILHGAGAIHDQRHYQQWSPESAAAVGVPPAGEAERFLRRVEQNLTTLTRTMPMAEIEDLPAIYAASCCWGATDLGPTILAFGKCCSPLWQGQ
jgi:hypothetical protein